MRTEFRDLLQCADYFKLSVNQKQKFLTKVASVSMSELVLVLSIMLLLIVVSYPFLMKKRGSM